ncbi:MAG: alpha/beta fold hydrolase, partial [Chloroflexota bacterium]|nr:alpha/beta fold hydrolase [Chloroflexota bacterium]
MDPEDVTRNQDPRPGGDEASLRAIAYLCGHVGGFSERPAADQGRFLQSLGLSAADAERVVTLLGHMEDARPVPTWHARRGVVPRRARCGCLVRPFQRVFEGLPWWIRCGVIARSLRRAPLVRRSAYGCCLIDWQPSVVAPVFYGIRDYGTAAGAPGPLRVYYPTLGESVYNEVFLRGCGEYPLVIFLHGHCSETDHYKHWHYVPVQLARSGFVVVAPQLPGIQGGSSPFGEPESDLILAQDVLWWMRDASEYRSQLECPPSTGIVGHSYGALLGARLSTVVRAAAYVSLGGGWGEWTAGQWAILDQIAVPSLFVWGDRDADAAVLGMGQFWNRIAPPKHKLVFEGVGHWDYLPEGGSRCAAHFGDCHHVGELA